MKFDFKIDTSLKGIFHICYKSMNDILLSHIFGIICQRGTQWINEVSLLDRGIQIAK